ncbi:MAG: serine/threonine-protein kinase [Acidobacteriota bacterium]|nr:serine/threonine-protein kinase [Acidobacteriota bacterium]
MWEKEDWWRLDHLVCRAMELSPELREAFLEEACGQNKPLFKAACSIIYTAEELDQFMEQPALPRAECLLPPDPETIGPYRVIKKLGEGGMGQVFLVQQNEPERLLALKVLKPGYQISNFVSRFRTEARLLAMLSHPNIGVIHECGVTARNRPYFVMEYLDGRPITRYCKEKKLGLRARLALFRAVCAGIQHAHLRGVIHRDLKPSNILVVERDGRPVPKLIDFGVARSIRESDQSRITRGETLLGTPAYMSPEQADRSLETDARTDVYSLGILLYELLTGEPPFEPEQESNGSLRRMLDIICSQTPEPPSDRIARNGYSSSSVPGIYQRELIKALKGDLDHVVLKALSKEPGDRYSSPEQFSDDIENYLCQRPVRAAPPNLLYQLGKFTRRNRLLVALGMTAVFSMFFGFFMLAQSYVMTSEAWQSEKMTRNLFTQMIEAVNPDWEAADPEMTKAYGRNLRVVDMIDNAYEKLEHDFAGKPRVKAAFAFTIGKAYLGLGMIEKAANPLNLAYEIRRVENGRWDEATLEIRLAQGLYHHLRDEVETAKTIFREIAGYNPDNQHGLTARWRLANLVRREEDYSKAIEMYRALLTDWKRLGQENDLRVAQTMNSLANALWRIGEHEEAERLYGRILETQADSLPESHSLLLATRNNLAELKEDIGENEVAQEIHQAVLDIRTEVYGPEHPTTLYSKYALATVNYHLEDMSTAVRLNREVKTALARMVPRDHEFALGVRCMEVTLLIAQGHYEQCLQLLEDLIPAMDARFGITYSNTAISRYHRAEALEKLGKAEKAEKAFRNNLDLLETQPEASQSVVMEARWDLAYFYHRRKNYSEAEKTMNALMKQYQKTLKEDDRTRLSYEVGRARLYVDMKRYREAADIFLNCHERFKRLSDPRAEEIENELRRLVEELPELVEALIDSDIELKLAKR